MCDVIVEGMSLSCYQCDSRYDPDCKEIFDHEHIDQLILRPTECTVDAAQYCIKTIGVWGGLLILLSSLLLAPLPSSRPSLIHDVCLEEDYQNCCE